MLKISYILFFIFGVIVGLRLKTTLSMQDRIKLSEWDNRKGDE